MKYPRMIAHAQADIAAYATSALGEGTLLMMDKVFRITGFRLARNQKTDLPLGEDFIAAKELYASDMSVKHPRVACGVS